MERALEQSAEVVVVRHHPDLESHRLGRRRAALLSRAMPQENVEIVRRVYAALNSRDQETLVHLADPEIVIDATRLTFNPGTYVGLEGLRELAAGTDDVWEEVRFEPLEFIDAGERVVVVERLTGKGKGSGVEVAQTWGAVWTVRDGRVARMELGFPDREAALAAVGLPA